MSKSKKTKKFHVYRGECCNEIFTVIKSKKYNPKKTKILCPLCNNIAKSIWHSCSLNAMSVEGAKIVFGDRPSGPKSLRNYVKVEEDGDTSSV